MSGRREALLPPSSLPPGTAVKDAGFESHKVRYMAADRVVDLGKAPVVNRGCSLALVGLVVILLFVLFGCSNNDPPIPAAPTPTPVADPAGRLACLQMRYAAERAARQGLSRLSPAQYERVVEQLAADYAVAAKLAEDAEPSIRDAMARLARVYAALDQVDPDEILRAPAFSSLACQAAGHVVNE